MPADNPSRTTVPNERVYRLRVLGTGAADPTVEIGNNITVDEVSTGLYRLTWTTAPGTFVTWSYAFGAATTSDLKGFTAVRDTYDTTNHQLDIAVYNASGTLTDLAANQYIDVTVVFSEGAL